MIAPGCGRGALPAGALLQIESGSFAALRPKSGKQGRLVDQWRAAHRNSSYMIVISRPYWLPFFSRGQTKVNWTALAAEEPWCGKTG